MAGLTHIKEPWVIGFEVKAHYLLYSFTINRKIHAGLLVNFQIQTVGSHEQKREEISILH